MADTLQLISKKQVQLGVRSLAKSMAQISGTKNLPKTQVDGYAVSGISRGEGMCIGRRQSGSSHWVTDQTVLPNEIYDGGLYPALPT
jgi:hypothetical protein